MEILNITCRTYLVRTKKVSRLGNRLSLHNQYVNRNSVPLSDYRKDKWYYYSFVSAVTMRVFLPR